MNSIQKILLKLTLIKGLGPIRIKNIIDTIDNIENLFNYSYDELKERLNIPDKIINNIISFKEDEKFNTIIKKIEDYNIKLISILDDEYPPSLKEIVSAPILLFYRGKLPDFSKIIPVAIVGTRLPSNYGIEVTKKIVNELCQIPNLTIISGLAEGIDSLAHKAALKTNGNTIAVVGTGLDVVYPASNKKLAIEIEKQNCIFSEFYPGSKIESKNFYIRNRIISGLSIATVVIEAGKKSGALITAKFAIDQNKEVFAVPGNINSKKSIGTNNLIKNMNAFPLTDVNDFFNFYPQYFENIIKKQPSSQKISISKNEYTIIKLLEKGPLHINQIINSVQDNDVSINMFSILTNLELKNIITQLPGSFFKLNNVEIKIE